MNNKSQSPPPIQGSRKGGAVIENKKDEKDDQQGSPQQTHGQSPINGIGWSEEIRRRANLALGKQKVNLKNAFHPNNTVANTGNHRGQLSPLLSLNQSSKVNESAFKTKPSDMFQPTSIVSESEEGQSFSTPANNNESSLLPSLSKQPFAPFEDNLKVKKFTTLNDSNMDEGLFKKTNNSQKESIVKKKVAVDWKASIKQNSDLEDVSNTQKVNNNTFKEGTKKVFEKRVSKGRKSNASYSSSASSSMPSGSRSRERRLPVALQPLKTDGCFNIESGQVREVFINAIDNDSNTDRSSKNEYLQKRLTTNPLINIKGVIDSDGQGEEEKQSPTNKKMDSGGHERKFSQEALQTTEFKPTFSTPINSQAPNLATIQAVHQTPAIMKLVARNKIRHVNSNIGLNQNKVQLSMASLSKLGPGTQSSKPSTSDSKYKPNFRAKPISPPSQNQLDQIRNGILTEDEDSNKEKEKGQHSESITAWENSPSGKNPPEVKAALSEKPTSSAGQKNYQQFLKYVSSKPGVPSIKIQRPQNHPPRPPTNPQVNVTANQVKKVLDVSTQGAKIAPPQVHVASRLQEWKQKFVGRQNSHKNSNNLSSTVSRNYNSNNPSTPINYQRPNGFMSNMGGNSIRATGAPTPVSALNQTKILESSKLLQQKLARHRSLNKREIMRKVEANGAALKGNLSMSNGSIRGKTYSTSKSHYVQNFRKIMGRNHEAVEHQGVEEYRDKRARFIENRQQEILKRRQQLETISRNSDKSSPVAGRIFRMNHHRSFSTVSQINNRLKDKAKVFPQYFSQKGKNDDGQSSMCSQSMNDSLSNGFLGSNGSNLGASSPFKSFDAKRGYNNKSKLITPSFKKQQERLTAFQNSVNALQDSQHKDKARTTSVFFKSKKTLLLNNFVRKSTSVNSGSLSMKNYPQNPLRTNLIQYGQQAIKNNQVNVRPPFGNSMSQKLLMRRNGSQSQYNMQNNLDQSYNMSNNESEYQGLQPKCVGVDNSVRYQVRVNPPYDQSYNERMEHLMKLRASSKLFGYKGLHKNQRFLSESNYQSPNKKATQDYQMSIGAASVFDENVSQTSNTNESLASSPFKGNSMYPKPPLKAPSFQISGGANKQQKSFGKTIQKPPNPNLLSSAKYLAVSIQPSPEQLKRKQILSNLRNGLSKALASPDKEKKQDLYNRLKERATRNISNPSRAHGYGSYAVPAFKSQTADTERRKREEESNSIMGKEWYKDVHKKAEKATMVRVQKQRADILRQYNAYLGKNKHFASQQKLEKFQKNASNKIL